MIEVATVTLSTGLRVTVAVEGEHIRLLYMQLFPLRLTPLEAVELGEALVEAGSRRWN